MALSLFAVLSQPFSNSSHVPQLSSDAWGVTSNPPPPSPAGALPHPFTTAAGHREGGLSPRPCAGGDRRALGPAGWPTTKPSPTPRLLHSPLLSSPSNPGQNERWREGSGSASGPPLIPPHPNPPSPPTLSPPPCGPRPPPAGDGPGQVGASGPGRRDLVSAAADSAADAGTGTAAGRAGY